ncbi:hypothetical protein VTL71DRAFT_9407 [Oculimacula yallundae]|uniref:Uncharacterized protein n=1 Tax=Oculimacula yallundae TaxID=86028 RepID=A0ABR4BT42_9HELO
MGEDTPTKKMRLNDGTPSSSRPPPAPDFSQGSGNRNAQPTGHHPATRSRTGNAQAGSNQGQTSLSNQIMPAPNARARTAKEWHARNNQKASNEQKNNTMYKQGKMRDILSGKATKDGKGSKGKQQPNRIDPQSFLGGSSVNRPADETDALTEVMPKNKKQLWASYVKTDLQGVDFHQNNIDQKEMQAKTVTLGLNMLKPQGTMFWNLRGVATSLYNHQVLGVTFAVAKECADEAPYGTIIADQMGLGKTIQAISIMVANPPSSEDLSKKIQGTLIICPAHLQDQWRAEFRKHTPDIGEDILQFVKADKSLNLTRLQKETIVITSYHQLRDSFAEPNDTLVKQWENAGRDVEAAKQQWLQESEEVGLLHKMKWYRIILDEAHTIKNLNTQTAQAAIALRGDKRHCLSGTPIMNRFGEFYPLLLFLREPITMVLKAREFEQKFCNQTEQSRALLSTLLSGIVIHRTLKDKLFGRPIVPMPAFSMRIIRIGQSVAEKIIYNAVILGYRNLFFQEFEKWDERQKLKSRFAQLTRLRQLLISPDLIAQQITKLLSFKELQILQQAVGQLRKNANPGSITNQIYQRLGMWINDKKNGVYNDVSEAEEEVISCTVCGSAGEALNSCQPCGHICCEICLDGNGDRDYDTDGARIWQCPECNKVCERKPVASKKPSKTKNGSKAKKQEPGKGTDAFDFRPSPGVDQSCFRIWLERLDKGELDVLHTAKMQAVLARIKDWLGKDPDDKIVIFTQFRQCLVIFGRLLQKLGFKFLYLSGDMNNDQRANTLKTFADDPTIKIMLASLQCGGTGLNLQMANKAIVVDLWWNECIDEQAFGRFFRIGQPKDCEAFKCVVKQTIDETLIEASKYFRWLIRVAFDVQIEQRSKAAAISGLLQDEAQIVFDEIVGKDAKKESIQQMTNRMAKEAQGKDPEATDQVQVKLETLSDGNDFRAGQQLALNGQQSGPSRQQSGPSRQQSGPSRQQMDPNESDLMEDLMDTGDLYSAD